MCMHKKYFRDFRLGLRFKGDLSDCSSYKLLMKQVLKIERKHWGKENNVLWLGMRALSDLSVLANKCKI
jgi:hypothetical protein